MRKGRHGEKTGGKKGKKIMIIVATNVMPVDRPNANRLERRPLVPKVLNIEP